MTFHLTNNLQTTLEQNKNKSRKLTLIIFVETLTNPTINSVKLLTVLPDSSGNTIFPVTLTFFLIPMDKHYTNVSNPYITLLLKIDSGFLLLTFIFIDRMKKKPGKICFLLMPSDKY